MPDAVQHAALIVGVLNLFHLDHLRLLQHLDGIEAVVMFRLHQVHATEATGTEGALKGEVIQRVFPFGGAGITASGVVRLRMTAGSRMHGALLGGMNYILYTSRIGIGLREARGMMGRRRGLRHSGLHGGYLTVGGFVCTRRPTGLLLRNGILRLSGGVRRRARIGGGLGLMVVVEEVVVVVVVVVVVFGSVW